MSDDNITPIRPPEVIAEVGGPIDESRVTLCILGEDLDPDEISAMLGCSPTRAHRRGDQPGRRSPPYRMGGWAREMGGKAPTEPEELLVKVLAGLPADPALWEELCRRFRVEIWLGLFLEAWNRGFDLSPQAIERVRNTGARLVFDIYGDSSEDEL